MMKRLLSRKITSKRGFSLAELLVVLLIMTIVAAAIGIGISSAASAYRDIRVSTEGSILCGTLTTELSDALRFSTNISVGSEGNAVFTSFRYGIGGSVKSVDGRIYVGSAAGDSPVLSESAYTELFADAKATYDGSQFTLFITIYDTDGESEINALELIIKPLAVPVKP